MALRETLELDLSQAQADIDKLERSIDQISTAVSVDVDVETRGLDLADREAEDLRQELEKVEDQADRVADEGDRIGREYKKGTDKAAKGLTGMSTAMKGFITVAAAGIAARAVFGFATDAVSAASDLEESTSKATVVFGEFSDEIFAFTSNAPEELGLSTAAATEMAGTFGNLFVALGLSQSAAADLAPDIVQLGSDLASFNNLEVQDALDKLRSGLVGEIEPLRSLGISFNAADVAQKAFALGLGDTEGALSESDKVLARYQLILEQTSTAQGDFARTADGLANSQRTLAAQWTDMAAAIGTELTPAVSALLPVLAEVIESFGPGLAKAAGSFAITLTSFAGLFSSTVAASGDLLKVMHQLNEEWTEGQDPVQLLGAGIAALADKGSATTDNIKDLADALGVSDADMRRAAQAALIVA